MLLVIFLNIRAARSVWVVFLEVLLLLQVALRPFATEVLNTLQALALLSLTVTQFVPIAVSSFYVANQQDREQVIDAGAAIFISVALVCLNSIVVVLYVAAAWKNRSEIADATQKVRSGITRSCCRRVCSGCTCRRCCRRRGEDNRRGSFVELRSPHDGVSNAPYVSMDD